MTKTVTVWEVSYHVSDDSPSAHGGAAGDGGFTARFRDEAKAKAFALTVEYYGNPAKALPYEASRALARRWGV